MAPGADGGDGGGAALPARPVVVAPLLLLAAATASYLYADRSLPNPDEGAILAATAKILRGLVFYRDIDAYPFPASSYLLAFAMSIFGEHLSVARALAGGIYCGLVLCAYAAALRVLDHRRAALFGASLLSLKFLAFPNYTAYLYADLAMLFAAAAMALFLWREGPGSALRLALVGACVAGAVVSKQSTGLYLGAAIGLAILLPGVGTQPAGPLARRLAGFGAFALGGAVGLAPMLVYFTAQGLLPALVYSGLVRPFTDYLPTSGVAFSPMLAWWRIGQADDHALQPYLPLHFSEMVRSGMLPGAADGAAAVWWLLGEVFARLLYTAVPVTFAACAWLWLRALRRARSGATPAGARFFENALLCAAVAASAFPRADFPHIITVYPVVLLALFSLSETRHLRLGRGAAADPRVRGLGVQAVLVAALLAATLSLALRFGQSLTHRLEVERAAVWVNPREAWLESVLAYVDREVPADGPLFVFGHEAQYYFLTGRYFPWPFVQLYPGMTGADQGQAIANVLASTRPRLVIQGVLYWPGMPELPRYAPALHATVKRLYVPETGSVFEAFPPRGGPPPEFVFRLWRLRGEHAVRSRRSPP